MEMEHTTKSIKDLLTLRDNKMLSVNPEYQRGAVWKEPQQKRLIDSVMRGYPIPLLYLHHIETEVAGHRREDFELIDGQQRIDALYRFREGAFKLFDPIADEKEARFPSFIKEMPCEWGGQTFDELSPDEQQRFLEMPLSVVLIRTDEPNEARDLFIRLQAGMPLNAQEKRDAWPGNFTEFVLKLGGKPEIARYPGHDFFKVLLNAKSSSGRGKFRQLAAQIAMLYMTRREGGRYCDIHSRAIDSFYYRHLNLNLESPESRRLQEIMSLLTQLFADKKRPKIIGHEAIHLVLLVDTLLDDYTRSWTKTFAIAFDIFRNELAQAKLTKNDDVPSEHWMRYGSLTRTNSDRADTIQRRHAFFTEKMLDKMKIEPKDSTRLFGAVERELIYYRDHKTCQVCDAEVPWDDVDIHHIDGHAQGGQTVAANGCLVHRHCHPKGKQAEELAERLKAKIR